MGLIDKAEQDAVNRIEAAAQKVEADAIARLQAAAAQFEQNIAVSGQHLLEHLREYADGHRLVLTILWADRGALTIRFRRGRHFSAEDHGGRQRPAIYATARR